MQAYLQSGQSDMKQVKSTKEQTPLRFLMSSVVIAIPTVVMT